MSLSEAGRELPEARIEDAAVKAARGEVACIPFLTPRARKQAERILRTRGLYELAWLWGGYAEAERACLFLLPDYMSAMLSDVPERCPADEVAALLADDVLEAVTAVRITGSGFRVLSHRDYLGSVLGLGIERDALGDIAVQNEHEAVLFCSHTMSRFLCEHLQKVASDTVKCRPWELDESFTDGRVYAPLRDTVASPRLDCVVAALTNLSREDAQGAIRSGLVEVDFEPCERTDLMLTPPTTLSVRGYGRFILRAFDGETRKNRLRMVADKLV